MRLDAKFVEVTSVTELMMELEHWSGVSLWDSDGGEKLWIRRDTYISKQKL